MFLKKVTILLLLLTLITSGCGEYQALLKSTDSEAKYAAALDFYEKKDYYRALQLFQDLINFYQGTEKAMKMQFYYAYCYYYQKDYVLAGYYFKRFVTNYPRTEYTEEAAFMNAYCYYLDSPGYTLDQSNTVQAITEMQLFLDRYPNSSRREECNELIEGLRFKLQRKDMNIANLYLKMEKYEAAITCYNNLLEDYPDTQFREEALFNIMKSYYYYALNSVRSKQQERLQATLDSYNELVFQYPESTFMREAENIRTDVLKKIDNPSLTSN